MSSVVHLRLFLRLCWICRLRASITSSISLFLASLCRRLCSARLVQTSFSDSSTSCSISSSSLLCCFSSSDRCCRYLCCSSRHSASTTKSHRSPSLHLMEEPSGSSSSCSVLRYNPSITTWLSAALCWSRPVTSCLLPLFPVRCGEI